MTHDNPKSPLKPQVIDLEAEDVTMEETGAPETPPPPPVPPKKSAFPTTWLAIALLVGAVAGGWLYKDVLSSYLPSNELITAQGRIDALEAQGKTLGEQLASVAATSDQLKTEIQGATEKSSAAQTATAALETRLAGLEAATQAAKAELEKLKSAVAKRRNIRHTGGHQRRGGFGTTPRRPGKRCGQPENGQHANRSISRHRNPLPIPVRSQSQDRRGRFLPRRT